MSVPTLKKHENGVWYVHWTEGRRSRCVSTRAKDVAVAKSFLATWLVMEREAPSAPATVYTVADLWSLYFTKHIEAETVSADSAKWIWKALEETFGAKPLAQVDAGLIERYVRDRRNGKFGRKSADATIRRDLSMLRACFLWCAHPKRKIIGAADVPLWDMPPEAQPRDRWLREEEIAQLFAAAEESRRGARLSRVERFLWLALETAARRDAICHLTWDRVDLETNVISYKDPTRRETKKKRAVVPISARLRPVLERALAERKQGQKYVLGHSGGVYQSVVAVAAKAEVEGVSPHVIRHTAATHMARRGVPLWIIAKVLGNTLAMVEKVYAKHCPDDLREAVDLISGRVDFGANFGASAQNERQTCKTIDRHSAENEGKLQLVTV